MSNHDGEADAAYLAARDNVRKPLDIVSAFWDQLIAGRQSALTPEEADEYNSALRKLTPDEVQYAAKRLEEIRKLVSAASREARHAEVGPNRAERRAKARSAGYRRPMKRATGFSGGRAFKSK